MNRLIVITILILVPWTLFAQINWTEHTIDGNFSYDCSVYAIDVDNDGDVDVLGAVGDAGEITWWENNGNEHFAEHTIDADFHALFVYAIDMDNDGDVDILGAGYEPICIAWWENDGDENFSIHPICFNDCIINCHAYPVDMDNDGDVDVLGAVVWGQGLAESYWWENAGGSPPIFYEHDLWDYYATFICGIDLDSDGNIDILEADDFCTEWGWDIFWRKNNGAKLFSRYGIDSTFVGVTSVYAIDMDNDSDVDVLGSGWSNDGTDIAWYENDGNENFSKYPLADDFNGANSVFAIDVDDDGDTDVLGAAMYADDITWWENNGSESFTKHTIAVNFDGAHSVYAIDVDNDGDVDVLGAARNAGEITWWESDLATVDVAPVSIDIPSTLPEDSTLNPKATVTNFCMDTKTFDVTCEIEPGAYTSTETVTDLASCDNLQVTFSPDFTFMSGIYTVKIYTQLAGDEYPENDTLEKVIETYDPGVAEGDLDIPASFSFGLKGNPTKGKAVFKLTLPKAVTVTLCIYDVTGRFVDKVMSGKQPAGTYETTWIPKTNAGVYFYALKSPWGSRTGKILFIR